MLARGSAAEVVSRHQDLRLAVGGLVQHKVGDILALFVVAQFVKEVFAKPGALDRLQELLGNDRVGVDVDHRQRCGDGGELGELLHVSFVSVRPQTRLRQASNLSVEAIPFVQARAAMNSPQGARQPFNAGELAPVKMRAMPRGEPCLPPVPLAPVPRPLALVPWPLSPGPCPLAWGAMGLLRGKTSSWEPWSGTKFGLTGDLGFKRGLGVQKGALG